MERNENNRSIGRHTITPGTPSNILLGAGTYHRGLKFENGAWTGTAMGATSGGGKIAIKGEFNDKAAVLERQVRGIVGQSVVADQQPAPRSAARVKQRVLHRDRRRLARNPVDDHRPRTVSGELAVLDANRALHGLPPAVGAHRHRKAVRRVAAVDAATG